MPTRSSAASGRCSSAPGRALTTPEQHIAFARRWGRIDINKFFRADATHPEIAEVRKEADQTINIGGGWHTDHSYDQVPAMGSILVARELPEFGGDTLFASMYAAYEALSDGLKETLAGRCSSTSTATPLGPSLPAGSAGRRARWRCGTTAALRAYSVTGQ